MPSKSKAQLLDEIAKLRAELTAVHLTKEERTAELYNSEQRFAMAMRSANDGLWDWDLQTDEVYYSPRWKSMLGYEEHELDHMLSTWEAIVHPDDRVRVLQKAQDYLSGIVTSFEVEMRMRHKDGHYLFIRSRAFQVKCNATDNPHRLIGTHVDITQRKKAEILDKRNAKILEMIAKGNPASEIYDEIALLYEERHPGIRCSMLELEGNKLLHGGAPSLPKEYCEAVHGLENGPNIGSCGTSTYTGKRVLVENIETDPKWANIKHVATPHGMRCCWSEPIKSSSGKVLGAFGMYYNHPALPNDEESSDLTSAARLAGIVMEREHNLKRIRELAYKDELTQLSSRAQFYLTLEKMIKSFDLNSLRFSLLYIDLDNFKNVNDSLGHDVGDRLLKEVAQRLQQACREVDLIARISGDEFCIIVNEVVDNDCAGKVAQRCLQLISEPVEFEGRKLVPSCSIGIAHYPLDGETHQTLLKAADTALYEAKELGKNRYAFYNEELTTKAEYRFKVEQYLREAIEKQQLSLVYQPQVDITSGNIVGVEALSRWYHPLLGQVSPVDFIATAESIGMLPLLTEWVLHTACEQLACWKHSGLTSVRVAVNISPSHFLDKDFVPLIARVLEKTGILPDDLELEVTEGVVQTNQQNLFVFEQLKELGVKLAIDDFGTGYSSVASLKHLNIDVLKIDKYFIDDILTDHKTRLLVNSMIDMGHNLGHKIIAEGVEKHEQLELLQKLGCEIGQGYLFSNPVSADEMSQLLNLSTVV
ncbi:EAL domain-containing protein [Photobacterium sp. SDRW27]|uniref:bifunctional diguanylate cyclase/phosphodiesterase n=1 Tax=Photobacterium obscurum TaxID=2829490 RepID=UPI002243C072|nr:EAL domain-containing protein [Photobacterium obscurum]MCW8327377.1 EAL domain-containing protein [Photobacterium obscurum]